MELDWAGLPLEVETIAESLSGSGYRTAMAGEQTPTYRQITQTKNIYKDISTKAT